MLNQKKIEIFLTKIRKSLAKQFLEIAFSDYGGWLRRNYGPMESRNESMESFSTFSINFCTLSFVVSLRSIRDSHLQTSSLLSVSEVFCVASIKKKHATTKVTCLCLIAPKGKCFKNIISLSTCELY